MKGGTNRKVNVNRTGRRHYPLSYVKPLTIPKGAKVRDVAQQKSRLDPGQVAR